MAYSDKLGRLLEKLITDGEQLLSKATPMRSTTVKEIRDSKALYKWASELLLFKSIAGDMIKPWKHELQHNGVVILAYELERPVIVLKTIQSAMADGLLVRFEDLVIADAFADLTEQARYLLSQGYFLAAGVILRAVLEEKLRNMCKRHSCVPAKANPTISDFNQTLYTASTPVYDKTMMQHVTAMAAIGNDAAHNNPALKKEDVERLMRDLPEFLARVST